MLLPSHIRTISVLYKNDTITIDGYSLATALPYAYPSALPVHSFRLLHSLSLATPISPLASFLAGCSLPSISTLRVNTPSGRLTTPDQVLHLLTVLSAHHNSIRCLQLDMLDADVDIIHQPDHRIGLYHLQPLLSFGLLRLDIRHAYPLALSDEDVVLMVGSWPQIEKLNLNCEPVLCLHATRPSILVLSQIASMCKDLTHLGLMVHTLDTIDAAPAVACPFDRIMYIHFGASQINLPGVTGLYLYHLCPHGMKMDYGVAWGFDVFSISTSQFRYLEHVEDQLDCCYRLWNKARAVCYLMQEARRRMHPKFYSTLDLRYPLLPYDPLRRFSKRAFC
jgi:hypothetical protein